MSVIMQNRYRELDQREEDLKRQLEEVRKQKHEIAQKVFSGAASAEADQKTEANSREGTQHSKPVRSELPTRTPIIRRSTLP